MNVRSQQQKVLDYHFNKYNEIIDEDNIIDYMYQVNREIIQKQINEYDKNNITYKEIGKIFNKFFHTYFKQEIKRVYKKLEDREELDNKDIKSLEEYLEELETTIKYF